MKKIFQILWLPVLIFFFNLTPLAIHLYATQPLFDVFMHTLGGFAIAYMFSVILSVYKISWWKQIPLIWKVLIIAGFVMLFGVAWEWYEFLSDTFLGTHAQPGLADTMYDLLFDFSGALIFCAAKFGLLRNRQ
jgi:hypothetical protein